MLFAGQVVQLICKANEATMISCRLRRKGKEEEEGERKANQRIYKKRYVRGCKGKERWMVRCRKRG